MSYKTPNNLSSEREITRLIINQLPLAAGVESHRYILQNHSYLSYKLFKDFFSAIPFSNLITAADKWRK